MTAIKNSAFATLLAVAAVATAQAQEPRLVGRVAEPARAQVDSIVAAARSLGLPTEPLIDRALEGAAKGAAGSLIVTAVARLRGELATAQRAFGRNATVAELTAGASALRAGATEPALAQLRSRRANQPVTVAAAVLADLVASGVPADTAVSAVLVLAAAADDAEYVAFRRSVQRDIALGASPTAAVGVRLALVPGATNLTANPGGPAGRQRQKP
jgi:hypothetical protein